VNEDTSSHKLNISYELTKLYPNILTLRVLTQPLSSVTDNV